MEKDRLVIELNGAKYVFDTADVASIVESERIPILPGSAGFVTGIISLRGEPVTVVDLGKVFNSERISEEGPRRIVVVRGKNRILGFDIGSADVSFLWEEELKGAAPAGEAYLAVDWGALFDETTKILSTEGTGA